MGPYPPPSNDIPPRLELGMLRAFLPLLLVALGTMLAGCATLVSGTTQTIGVNTDPEGADCQFTREGVLVGRVNPTPGTIQIGKDYGSISVLCQKEGFEDTAGVVGSEFQAMTLGNI